MKKSLIMAAVFMTQFSYAGSAISCISVGSGSNSQTLTNNCNYKVEVAWCHTLNKRGYKDGLCKSNGKYYQKHTVLKPGAVKRNQYSLPYNSTIYYAACKGNYYTIEQDGMSGSFFCKK